MIAEKIPVVQSLSLREKLLLANELLDEVEAAWKDAPPADSAILALLNRRFAEYERDPSTAISWEQFKTRRRESK